MYLSRKWKISIVSHVWTSIISCMYIVSLHWFKELKMFSIFWILSWSSWGKICLFFWTNYVILLLPHVHPHAFAATKDRLPDLLPPFTKILLSYFIILVKVTLNYLTLLCHLKTLISACLFLQPPCCLLTVQLEYCPLADTWYVQRKMSP